MTTEKFIATTKDGKIRNANEAIFPIIKQLHNDNWQLIGTGFFVTKHGLFLTAKHVLRDVLDSYTNQQTHPIAALLFLPNNKFQIRRVLKGFLNVPGDIAAGIIANTNEFGKLLGNSYYGLNHIPPTIGEKIHTYAYPETTHEDNTIKFRGDYYEGEIEKCLPDGRDQTMLPNSCYQTNMKILPGASGGPVFNNSGSVVGINSTGFNDANPPYTSFISSVNDAFDIIIEDITLPFCHIKKCNLRELLLLLNIIENTRR